MLEIRLIFFLAFISLFSLIVYLVMFNTNRRWQGFRIFQAHFLIKIFLKRKRVFKELYDQKKEKI